MSALGKFIHTPDEVKIYSIDYSDWLETGEEIIAVRYETDNETTPPIAATDITFDANSVSFYISGGVDGERYKVVIEIETSIGQIKQDFVQVVIRDHTP
jgi:hypothetical protein